MSPAIEEINNLRKNIQILASSWKTLQSKLGDNTLEVVMRELNKRADISEDDKNEGIISYRSIVLFNSFHKLHLSMKSSFTDIVIGGQVFKADIFIWLPSNPDFKLIVESDGFGSYTKNAALYDVNAIDCLLQAKGFQVFRLPGQEIINDPVGQADELYRYLVTHTR